MILKKLVKKKETPEKFLLTAFGNIGFTDTDWEEIQKERDEER
jgi:hypothetical protein